MRQFIIAVTWRQATTTAPWGVGLTGTSVIMNTYGSVGMQKKCSNLKTHICYIMNRTELNLFHIFWPAKCSFLGLIPRFLLLYSVITFFLIWRLELIKIKEWENYAYHKKNRFFKIWNTQIDNNNIFNNGRFC